MDNIENSSNMSYTLNVVYNPMTQSQLVNSFALGWYIYIIIYIIIASFTVVQATLLSIFHFLVNR